MSTPGEGFGNTYPHPDQFQEMWADPARLAGALYVHERFLVRPDDTPVARHHLLVVARGYQPWERLSYPDQLAMFALVSVTYAHMTRVLDPKRKVGVAMWGNQVRTGHAHLIPRQNPTDATVWKRMELGEEALAAQLAETRELLAFPDHLKSQADALLDQTLAALETVEMPNGLLLPPLPQPGEPRA
jgi:diadenosine tetraphosphate (Ap4A) HIT family hydrolase